MYGYDVRGTDPTIPRAVNEAKLKVIDKRRHQIDTLLASYKEETYHSQELRAELAELSARRLERYGLTTDARTQAQPRTSGAISHPAASGPRPIARGYTRTDRTR